MEGKEVLWLPGTDHAGIGTQAVVERDLRKQGLMKHRDDLGREKFLEHAWTWKEKHGGIIIEQLRSWAAPVIGLANDLLWTRLIHAASKGSLHISTKRALFTAADAWLIGIRLPEPPFQTKKSR
jgi:hypothetical protein